MKKLRDVDYKIISALMKNSRMSDRRLAKAVGVSQPTVSRRRHMLQKEELLEFTTIPDLAKFGFEIMAFSFYSWTPEATGEMKENQEEILKRLDTFLLRHKNIIFASFGRGFGMDRMMISFHKSYADYARLMQEVKQEWGMYLRESNSFTVSTIQDIVGRKLTLKHLADYIYENR